MMGAVTEFRPGREAPPDRPTVATSGWMGGFRVSTVRRVDGSTFTVTVPCAGVAEETEHLAPRRRWISGEGSRRPSDTSLLALAAAVVGAGCGPPATP